MCPILQFVSIWLTEPLLQKCTHTQTHINIYIYTHLFSDPATVSWPYLKPSALGQMHVIRNQYDNLPKCIWTSDSSERRRRRGRTNVTAKKITCFLIFYPFFIIFFSVIFGEQSKLKCQMSVLKNACKCSEAGSQTQTHIYTHTQPKHICMHKHTLTHCMCVCIWYTHSCVALNPCSKICSVLTGAKIAAAAENLSPLPFVVVVVAVLDVP